MADEKEHLLLCKQEIEHRYQLHGADLMERDYEFLHLELLSKTKTDISTSTLRRLWTNKFSGIPQIKTLDALAKLIEYQGWHHFKSSNPLTNRKRSGFSKMIPVVAVALALLGIVVVISGTGKAVGKGDLQPEVNHHEGVPATIGFHYEIDNAATEIELSWNPYERVLLNPEENFYSGTYFYPDYHHAKLIYEQELLAQTTVHITTEGWHGLIMDSGLDTRPQYLEEEVFLFDEGLSLSMETIRELGLEDENELFTVYTLSHQKLGEVSGDSFQLYIAARSEVISRDQVCGLYDIVIKGDQGSMRVPISEVGCYGITQLKCGKTLLSGKTNNLSALQTHTKERHEVRIEVKNQVLTLEVGSNDAFVSSFEGKIGQLKVIKFIHSGVGELSDFRVESTGGNMLEGSFLYPFTTPQLIP